MTDVTLKEHLNTLDTTVADATMMHRLNKLDTFVKEATIKQHLNRSTQFWQMRHWNSIFYISTKLLCKVTLYTFYFYKSSSFTNRRRNYGYRKTCKFLLVFTTQTKKRNCTMYWNTVYKYKSPMDVNFTTLSSLNKIKIISLFLLIFIQTVTETNPVLKDDTLEYVTIFPKQV